MKFLIFSAFDPVPPDNMPGIRYFPLAERILQQGHSVTYLTFNYSNLTKQHRPYWDTKSYKGRLSAVMLPVPAYENNRSLKRIYSHLAGAFEVRKYLHSLSKDDFPDIIIAASPPILADYFLLGWAKKH